MISLSIMKIISIIVLIILQLAVIVASLDNNEEYSMISAIILFLMLAVPLCYIILK